MIHLLSVMIVTVCERSNTCSGQILASDIEKFVLIKIGSNKTINNLQLLRNKNRGLEMSS